MGNCATKIQAENNMYQSMKDTQDDHTVFVVGSNEYGELALNHKKSKIME